MTGATWARRGGYDDWRVPTRIELTSIMDFSLSGAKLDARAFAGESGDHFTEAWARCVR